MTLLTKEEIESKLTVAEERTGHRFQDIGILLEALTHRSYANEAGDAAMADNDRLEYLGDAVLELVISKHLYKEFPEMDSGQMTKLRASLVNEKELASIAGESKLGECLLLGKGEAMASGGEKPSVLSDFYEALLGAVFLDGELAAAETMIMNDMGSRIAQHSQQIGARDGKSQLQEICAKHRLGLPSYSVVERSGPDHETLFTVECKAGKSMAAGKGRSIKIAEQEAAALLLEIFAREEKENGATR